jgi:predicted nucleic acid-binding protein
LEKLCRPSTSLLKIPRSWGLERERSSGVAQDEKSLPPLLNGMSGMKALLDTNIVIHREAATVVHQDIGTLFKWLDKAKYTKCIHPVTVGELQQHGDEKVAKTIRIKLESYSLLKTVAPLADQVKAVSDEIDINLNDRNDTKLLNEVFQGRVDILISEDKKIHIKADMLGMQDRVFTINAFLEKIVSEHPELINYNVLSVAKKHFGEIDLQDPFFDSFRLDYVDFDKWFNRKADEVAYVTHNRGRILSFLYLKEEDADENYSNISPVFKPKRRLKIGTFKVVSNGVRLGERFLKIIFDNALQFKVEEIYVTIFDRTDDQKRLIDLLLGWGFVQHGTKQTSNGDELVFIRDFAPRFDASSPRRSFPYISTQRNVFLCPIYPKYHTELFPDSILTTESPLNFQENQPHRNALSKVFISRSIERGLTSGDVIVFYCTGGIHKSVVTTIGIVENIITGIKNEDEFVLKSRKRSVFSDEELKEWWNYNTQNRPFVVNFLYAYSFPKRPNLRRLIEIGVIDGVDSAPRGFEKISTKQFMKIMKESQSNESIIVN